MPCRLGGQRLCLKNCCMDASKRLPRAGRCMRPVKAPPPTRPCTRTRRLEALAGAGSEAGDDGDADDDGEAAGGGGEPVRPQLASGKLVPAQMTFERRSTKLLHELAPVRGW